MYTVDGIVYAGEKIPEIKIRGVRPLGEYKLWLRFSTGEARIFDFSPLLKEPAFAPLEDPEVFNGVYIDYGMTVWKDGEIDIAPAYLYNHSVAAETNMAG